MPAVVLLCVVILLPCPGCGTVNEASAEQSPATEGTPEAVAGEFFTVSGDTNPSDEAGPVLCVAPMVLLLTSAAPQGQIGVRNCDVGVLDYTLATDVPWLSVGAVAGTSTGETDFIDVLASGPIAGPGKHLGHVIVMTADGQSAVATAQFSAGGVSQSGRPVLSVSPGELDFGSAATTLALTISNAGLGTLRYSISNGASWTTVQPSEGEVTIGQQSVSVTLDRRQLIVGAHETSLTVTSDVGDVAVVHVDAVKAATSPLVIPWLDAWAPRQDEREIAIAGIEYWQHVTTTFLIDSSRGIYTDGSGTHNFYTDLRERFPHLTFIGGFKSATRITPAGSFSSPEAWQLLAEDVSFIAQVTGQSCVLLDHELTLRSFHAGTSEIDFNELELSLQQLPPGIQIIWYPTVCWENANSPPDLRARTGALTELVNRTINCRLVDLSFGGPGWGQYTTVREVREYLDQIALHPTAPLAYFSSNLTNDFYRYYQGPEAILDAAGRPDTFFYPATGTDEWLQMSIATVDAIESASLP